MPVNVMRERFYVDCAESVHQHGARTVFVRHVYVSQFYDAMESRGIAVRALSEDRHGVKFVCAVDWSKIASRSGR